MAKYHLTQGSKIEISGAASPSVFTQIANVISIEESGSQIDPIDTTNLDSTAKEFAPGLPDYGTVTVQLNWDPDEATHAALLGLESAGITAPRDIRITESGGGSPGTKTQGRAFLQSLSRQRAVNGVVKSTAVFKRTGPNTYL